MVGRPQRSVLRCVLAERLHTLLDEGTGAVRPELVAFLEGLRRVTRPAGGLTWIANPHVQQLLRTLSGFSAAGGQGLPFLVRG
jgi:hypothetical protein